MTLRVPWEQCPQHPPRPCAARPAYLPYPPAQRVDSALTTTFLDPLTVPHPPNQGPRILSCLSFLQDQSSSGGQLHHAQPPSPPGIWGPKDSESGLEGLTVIHPFPCSTTDCYVTPARPVPSPVTQGQAAPWPDSGLCPRTVTLPNSIPIMASHQ